MKTHHDGDCAIYALLINGNPEDGICICGYGLQQLISTGDRSDLYSEERKKEIELRLAISKLEELL